MGLNGSGIPPDRTADQVSERAREAASERLIARMREGIDFGGEKFNREELYEERIRQLGRRQSGHIDHRRR
jgi:hypothetical protein